MAEITHELMKMPDRRFPLKLLYRETDSASAGCEYHWHEQLEFYFVLQGGILLQNGDRRGWLYEGDIAAVNYCVAHKSLLFLDSTRHYCIQIDLRGMFLQNNEGVENRFFLPLMQHRARIEPFIKKDGELGSLIKKLIAEYKEGGQGYELEIKSILYSMFSKLHKAYLSEVIIPKHATSYVHQILTYAAENYTSEITLAEIAKRLYISVPYMCRLFKANTGVTLIEYINTMRCHKARQLLDGGMNVTEAAGMVGYNDPNYFSRVFKKIFSVPPSSCHNSE